MLQTFIISKIFYIKSKSFLVKSLKTTHTHKIFFVVTACHFISAFLC